MIKKLTLFLALISILAIQSPVFAQEGIGLPEEITNMKSEGFTIVPADPNSISPRKFIFEIQPGSSTHDSVLIQNLSNETATFFLYGADPTFSSQGTPAYKTRDAGGDGEGQWITFDETQTVLGPGEQKSLTFTLTIPEETALGDYRVGIAMEKTRQDINNPNVTIATRVILHSDIKVTNSPQIIPKLSGSQETPKTAGGNTLQLYYFWISLTLFIASFMALVWITFQEKKSPIETVATSAAASRSGSAKKKSTSREKSSSSKTPRAKKTRRSATKKKK